MYQAPAGGVLYFVLRGMFCQVLSGLDDKCDGNTNLNLYTTVKLLLAPHEYNALPDSDNRIKVGPPSLSRMVQCNSSSIIEDEQVVASEYVDRFLKVCTQLAREGVVVIQDGCTEVSLVIFSRRAGLDLIKELNNEWHLRCADEHRIISPTSLYPATRISIQHGTPQPTMDNLRRVPEYHLLVQIITGTKLGHRTKGYRNVTRPRPCDDCGTIAQKHCLVRTAGFVYRRLHHWR